MKYQSMGVRCFFKSRSGACFVPSNFGAWAQNIISNRDLWHHFEKAERWYMCDVLATPPMTRTMMPQMTPIQMALVSAAHRVAMHASGYISRVGRCPVHAVLACFHVVRGADTNIVNQCHTPVRDTGAVYGV